MVGPQKLASDELVKHKDKAVRTLVAAALSEAATPEAVDAADQAARGRATPRWCARLPPASVALAIRAAPARCSHCCRRTRRCARACSTPSPSSTSAPGIAKLLDATDSVDLKRSLVSLLRDTHDPRVADTFAKLLGDADADIKQTSASALAELGDARVDAGAARAGQVRGPHHFARRPRRARRMVAKPEVADALLPMLKDNPGRKASLIKAIGKSGSTTAGASLVEGARGRRPRGGRVRARRPQVRAGLQASCSPCIKRPKDVDFSKPSVPTEEIVRNREIAIRALGRYGKPDAIPALVTIIEDGTDSAKLRAIAGAVLGQLADQKTLADIIAKAKSPALDEATRTYYVQGLWQADAQAMSGQLADLLQPSVPAEVRRSAALAIGYAADPANDQLLLDLLRNNEVKREASFAVVLGGSPAAADELYNADRTPTASCAKSFRTS